MKVVCIDKSGVFGDEYLYYTDVYGRIGAANFLQHTPGKGGLDKKAIDTLEIDKIYTVRKCLHNVQFESGYIIDDFLYFNQSRFKLIDEVRDEKLKQLGIYE